MFLTCISDYSDIQSEPGTTDCGEGGIHKFLRTEGHDSKFHIIQEIWEWGRVQKQASGRIIIHTPLRQGRDSQGYTHVGCPRSLLKSWDLHRAEPCVRWLQRQLSLWKRQQKNQGHQKGPSALLSQEETLGRKDSVLEKVMQHQDTTQEKQKCPEPLLQRSLWEEWPWLGGGNPRQGAGDGWWPCCPESTQTQRTWAGEPRLGVRPTWAKSFLFSPPEPRFYCF